MNLSQINPVCALILMTLAVILCCIFSARLKKEINKKSLGLALALATAISFLIYLPAAPFQSSTDRNLMSLAEIYVLAAIGIVASYATEPRSNKSAVGWISLLLFAIGMLAKIFTFNSVLVPDAGVAYAWIFSIISGSALGWACGLLPQIAIQILPEDQATNAANKTSSSPAPAQPDS